MIDMMTATQSPKLYLVLLIGTLLGFTLYSKTENINKFNIINSYTFHTVYDTDQLCFERGFRAYLDALIHQEYNFFTSICSVKLKRLNGHTNIVQSKVKEILHQDYVALKDYALVDYDIQWKELKVISKNKATLDVFLSYAHAERDPVISHMMLTIELDGKCLITSATYEMVNSF